MKITRWIRLPWRIKDVVRSMRTDLAESRRMTAELVQRIAALEQRYDALPGKMSSLRETLVGEIQEQGLLVENVARFSTRAAAEQKLRNQLIPPAPGKAGVSVLIACWNHAGLLPRAAASAVATLDALPVPGEVLILDDASRDGSREVAEELARADERIRLIASDENLGLPRARNVLLSQAAFDHAMILDADNQLVPSGVATLYVSARQTGAVLAYGNILKIDQSGSVLGVISNEHVTADLLKENWIDAMALVQRDRLLELGGYECQWLYGMEDWELTLRLYCLREPVVFVPVLVGKYHVSPLSMIHEAPLSTRRRRGRRIFGSLDTADATGYRASVHHPAIGTLWASSEWSAPAPESAGRALPSRASSRLKILVVTSAGVRNYGDDAILLSTLQRLRRIRPDCLASVVSDGPACPPLGRLGAWSGTCEEFGSGLSADEVQQGCGNDQTLVEELSRWLKLGSRTAADLRTFDVVLFAGGGNLNSYWPELIARRAAIAAAANAAGVPYILSGQGVGPVSVGILPMLSFLIGGATAVATRDPFSLSLLQGIVPGAHRMHMVGDDALGMHCDDPNFARNQLAEIGVPSDRPLLGFHAREAGYVGLSRDELRETARQVDEFAAEKGYVVVSVPINMQPHGPEAELLADLAYGSRRRALWHVVNPAGNVAAIAGVIKICKAFLTHSYHAALFALEDRIPTLLFARTEYYHLKADALRAGFGIPVPIDADPCMDKTSIAEQLENVARSSWSRGMTGADVDSWLEAALPQGGRALASPSTGQHRYTRHPATSTPPPPKTRPSPGSREFAEDLPGRPASVDPIGATSSLRDALHRHSKVE